MLTTKNPAWQVIPLLLLCLVTAGWVAGCSRSPQAAFQEGRQLLEQGRAREAVAPLQFVTESQRTNATAWNFLGLAYHGSGDFTNALNAYNRSLTHNPALAEARYNLGCLYLENGLPDLARNEFTTFTVRRPQEIEGWLKLGTAQLRTGRDPAGAERSFVKVLQLSSNHVEALNGCGLSQLQRNRPRDAAALFQRALAQQPSYAPALLNLAIVEQTQLNSPALALQHYRAYLNLQPRPPAAEQAEAAVRALTTQLAPRPAPTNAAVVATPPSNAPLRATTTITSTPPRIAAVSNPPVQAPPPAVTNPQPPRLVAHAPPATQEIVRLPDPAQIPESRDVSHPTASVTNAPPPAEAAAQPAVAPTPVQASATTNKEPRRTFLQRMNPVRWFDGDKKPAAPAVTKTNAAPAPISAPKPNPVPPVQIAAAATPPPQPAALRFKRYSYLAQAPKPGTRGDALPRFSEAVQAQRSGDMNSAITGYRAALQADPAFFEAWFNLGIAAYDLGQISQALSAYETALVLRPEARDVRYNFALALRAGDCPLDAAEELKKLLAGNPGEVRVQLSLANLYALQLGQPALARQHYQRVLASEPNHPQAASIRSWLAANPE